MSDTGKPAEQILQLAKQAKKAARELAAVSGEVKAAALSGRKPGSDLRNLMN